MCGRGGGGGGRRLFGSLAEMKLDGIMQTLPTVYNNKFFIAVIATLIAKGLGPSLSGNDSPDINGTGKRPRHLSLGNEP